MPRVWILPLGFDRREANGEDALQEFSVMGYTLLLSLIEYKTLVMRGDFDAANEILPQIPQVQSRTLQPSIIRCLQSPCGHAMQSL